VEIDVNKLSVSSFNVRKIINKEKLEDFKQSIKSKGTIEPLIIRTVGVDKYEVIAGQLRFLMGKEVGLKKFECVIKQLSDSESIKYSLIENLQRTDVNDIDIAEGLKKLYDLVVTTKPKLSVYQFALELEKEIGLHEASIRRYLSLVNLVPELKEMVSDGKISIESGAKLKQLKEDEQKEFVKEFSEILEEEPITEMDEEEIVRENPNKMKESIEKVVRPNIQFIGTIQIHHIQSRSGEKFSFGCPHCKKITNIMLKSIEEDNDCVEISYK
jgi:ParB family chromosome partitioning protein